MHLHEIVLKNFRPYAIETRIPVDDFTAIIGKNDVGKSCILEALEVFFNENLVKIDADDATKGSNDNEILIGCVFSDLPASVVIDENASTSLEDEYLLNADGNLEIIRVFDTGTKKISSSTYARALHPSTGKYDDLLILKNADLKKRMESLGVQGDGVNRAINNSMRKAIWNQCADLNLTLQLIPLDKEDAKKLWVSLEPQLPMFALFQADRASRDEDAEVQDPMKAAILQALKTQQPILDQIKEAVRLQAMDVAVRTLKKLKEWDEGLANELSPNFKAEPKWDQIFKIALTGDEQIPINKRGSGVRRLVLLSFFRAEAEKRRDQGAGRSLIYGIEEPETSQHPNFQRLLIEALLELTEANCQVLITTHNPALAGYVPASGIRYIERIAGTIVVQVGNDDVLDAVARTLGVLPDNRVAALVCVEGPTDVEFLRHASHIYHAVSNDVPDLSDARDVAFLPHGGSNLRQWVDHKYLKGFGRPEIHLYDKGSQNPPQYEGIVAQLHAAGEYAVLTGKREIENYYHHEAVGEVYGMQMPPFGNDDRVPEIVARKVHDNAQTGTTWDGLDDRSKESKIGHVKKRLAKDALPRMSHDRLVAADPDGLIIGFLRQVETARSGFLRGTRLA